MTTEGNQNTQLIQLYKPATILCLYCSGCFTSSCSSEINFKLPAIPSKHQQVLLVTTDSWDSPTGNLVLLDRVEDQWIVSRDSIQVVLGANGLAWGNGQHSSSKDLPKKKEEDKKAPAGIFSLGTCFGYADQSPVGVDFPYRQATSRDYFIDDINSTQYNTWQNLSNEKENKPKSYWNSYESMKRSDHLYELGMVINHNTTHTIKCGGSAIFFHIWRAAKSPILDCTAMDKSDLAFSKN